MGEIETERRGEKERKKREAKNNGREAETEDERVYSYDLPLVRPLFRGKLTPPTCSPLMLFLTLSSNLLAFSLRSLAASILRGSLELGCWNRNIRPNMIACKV
jgi:hypothetical protein